MLSEGYKRRAVGFRSRTSTLSGRRRRRTVPRLNLSPAKTPGTRDSVCDPDHRSIRSCHRPLDDLPLSSSASVDPCLKGKKVSNIELLR